ncbi:MAG: exonuclease domain-containing protein [Lachnospiraceae bacterium]|nr:exonuclease domain-containing protein [Lachnospiraceae bacterium]
MSKYVVVDLEMCKVAPEKRKAAGYGRGSETIQIGAVLLNEKYEITDEFNIFVRPEYGFMDTFIMNLTGINSRELRDAPSMKEALLKFIDWIPEDAQVVSWSNTDRGQIKYEAAKKGIVHDRLDTILETWIDSQEMFMEKIAAERKYKLSEALIVSDIDQQGKEHNGLTDAYNTAKLFSKMMVEPQMKLNPYFVDSRREKEERFSFSMADAFRDIHFE